MIFIEQWNLPFESISTWLRDKTELICPEVRTTQRRSNMKCEQQMWLSIELKSLITDEII